MRLTEILQPECVKVPLTATAKQAAIYELVDLLVAKAGIDGGNELKEAVWQRENTRTTGIGITAQPIDFGAIDGKPVSLIFLLASPREQTGPHIQALASISRMLTDETFRAALKQAGNAESVYTMIAEHEAGSAV